MNDAEQHFNPDRELAARLRAMDVERSPSTVSALRARILDAAAQRLTARANAHARPLRLVSWVDVMSSVGRVAIPLSLAAALLAMALLPKLPQTTAMDDTSTALAYDIVSDSVATPRITDELLLPENADAVLLATTTTVSRP